MNAIILFDGNCVLCARSARFIARRDPKRRFRLAALHSAEGEAALRRAGYTGPLPLPAEPDSVLVIDGKDILSHSDAALRIVGRLRAPWPMLSMLRFIPKSLRDRLYRFIARRRYRWFGRSPACLMPTDDLRERFLTLTEMGVARTESGCEGKRDQ